jgi:predicted pyridoxine 5'-phosphate oxidase superfamily flavin-nucleotide-binding protein
VKAQHFHAGELEAQQRFNPDWNAEKSQRLGRIIGDTLDQRMTDFIARQTFFFLATADAEGHCDCSFKGTESAADGQALPAVWVTEPRRLLFPDYAGNRLFNSLGNILANPNLGMIFIEFSSQSRLRVNGSARILEADEGWRARWPEAQRAVAVAVEQVYWNCSKRIPRET